MNNKVFEYRMDKPYILVIAIGMFLLFAYLAWTNLENPYYVLKYKRHYFSVDSSRYIMIGSVAFSLISALIFMVGFVLVTKPRKVVVGEEGFEVPLSNWTKKMVKVRYDDVLGLKVLIHKKYETLVIDTKNQQVKVSSVMFPNQDEYMYLSKCISRKKYIG